MSYYLITLLSILPVIALVCLALCYRFNLRSYRYVAIILSILPMSILVFMIYQNVQYGNLSEFTFNVDSYANIIKFQYGVDSTSLWLAMVINIVVITVILLGVYIKKRQKQFYSLVIMVQIIVFHMLFSQDGLLFICTLLILAFLSLIMLSIWSEDERHAKQNFYFQLAGIFFISISFMLLLPINTLGWDQANIALGQQVIYGMEQVLEQAELTGYRQLSFVMLVIGLLCYIPLFGIHRPLITVYRKGHYIVTMLYTVTVGLIGVYILYRVGWAYFFDIILQIKEPIMWIFGVQWLIGNINLWRQKDIKSWLAYLIWSQYSILIILMLTATEVTLTLSWVHLFSFILCSALLTSILASLYERTQTLKWTELEGSLQGAPFLSGLLLIAAAIWWGLPAMSQFLGSYYTILHSFNVSRWLTVIIVIGFIIGISHSVRMMYLLQQGHVAHRQHDEKPMPIVDLRFIEVLPIALLLTLIIVLGISPNIVIKLMQYDISDMYQYISHTTEHVNQSLHSLLSLLNMNSEVWSIGVIVCVVASLVIWMVNYRQRNVYVMLFWQLIYHILTIIVVVLSSNELGVQIDATRSIYISIWYAIMFVGSYSMFKLIMGNNNSVTSLNGLYYRKPIYAAIILVFMLALMSTPLTAGFSYQLSILEIWSQHGQYGLIILWVIGHVLMAMIPMECILNIYVYKEKHLAIEADIPFAKWYRIISLLSLCLIVIMGVWI